MSVFVGNIQDDKLRTAVAAMGAGHCRCFDRESTRAGHDIYPPCDAIVLAQKIIKALDGPAVPLQERFGIQEWADWSDYPGWVDFDGGTNDYLRFDTREEAEKFILDRVTESYERELARYNEELPKYEEFQQKARVGRAALEHAGVADIFFPRGTSKPREPKSIEVRLQGYHVVRDSEMDSPESEQ